MAGANDVFHIPASPSITERRDMLIKKGASGLGSLADDILPHHYPLQSRRGSQDHEVEREVRDTNLDHVLGAREKSGNSRSSVESVQHSGPPDTGVYKRFNGKEQKEREKTAENWIPAVVKKRVESNKKASGTPIQVVKKETFLYEYAVYQKDRYFIDNIKNDILWRVD